MAEIWLAGQATPVAFLRDGAHWRAMAMFSPGDGANRFVDVASGRWRGAYIPALMRAYPFRLSEADRSSLKLWPGCQPEPLGDDVRPFLAEDGKPTEEVRRIHQHLRQAHAGIDAAHQPLQWLDDQDLLERWVPAGLSNNALELRDRPVFTINAEGFNSLDDEGFLKLRHWGALPWIIAQQHSLHHARWLAGEPESYEGMAFPEAAEPDPPFDDEALSFLGNMLNDDGRAPGSYDP